MTAEKFIDHSIPYLKGSDNVGFAIDLMNQNRLFELPLIENSKLLGFLSEDTLLELSEDMYLGEIQIVQAPALLKASDPSLRILIEYGDSNLEYLGVEDESEEFLGIIKLKDFLASYAAASFKANEGAIIEFLIEESEFSLSEIARMVESEGHKILAALSEKIEGSKYKVTLKINTYTISKTLATFQRAGYIVTEYFSQEEVISVEKENYDNLMRYLSI